MNETSASRDASSTMSAADVIRRLSAQCGSSSTVRQLVQAHEEAEGLNFATAIRVANQPELQGLGTSFTPAPAVGEPIDAGADAVRAKGSPSNSNSTVQRVGLHGAAGLESVGTSGRAEVAEKRSLPTADETIALVDSRLTGSETVQPLSVKNSENNGCTVGSSSPPEAASQLASRDNLLASPPPARSTHEDNEPCTAPAPSSPMQEISGAAAPAADFDEQISAEAPLAKIALGYCRCDFFDNGPMKSSTNTKAGRGRARYRVNTFLGSDKRNVQRFKIAFPSEARFFKRSIPNGHFAFYEKVWARFEGLRQTAPNDGIPMDIRPIIAHLKDKNNHVVPRTAAVLFKVKDEPADIILFLDGSVFALRLDQRAKGSQKCAALKALGYWKPE